MLKTTLLNILADCLRLGSAGLTSRVLKIEAERNVGGRIGDGDLAAALGDLQDRQLVAYKIHPLSDDRVYHITELGRTQI